MFTDACLSGISGITSWDYYTSRLMPSTQNGISIEPISECEYLTFVPEDHYGNINILELVAVYLALLRWCIYLSNSRTIINCHNKQVCYMLCKDRSRNSFASAILSDIFWLCVENNLYLSPQYIASKDS